MNDPHVEALIYRVEHGPTVNYERAEPLELVEQHFTVRIAANTATFTMKTHFTNAGDALAVIAPFVHAWELRVGLERGPDEFRLVYDRPEIIDRNPSPGSIRGNGVLAASKAAVLAGGVLTTHPASYPQPPMALSINPDVEVMYFRYMLYRQGRDLLGNMANFCLNVLEWSAKGHQRSAASKDYHVHLDVLNKLGALTAEKGGREARKAKGIGKDFTSQEQHWIDATIKAIIRRAAKVAYDPRQPLNQITLADLPDL